jgi:hypothetical protein
MADALDDPASSTANGYKLQVADRHNLGWMTMMISVKKVGDNTATRQQHATPNWYSYHVQSTLCMVSTSTL